MKRRFCLTILICVVCGVSSCDDDPSAPCPVYEVGALEGYVLGGGLGVQARVDVGDSYLASAYAESDSTGWYRLELPSGVHHVRVRPIESIWGDSEQGLAIQISRDVRRWDFIAGRVEIDVAMPAALEGRRIASHLACLGTAQFCDTRVQDGHLRRVYPFAPVGPTKVFLRSGVDWYWPGTFAQAEAGLLQVPPDHLTTLTWSLDEYASISGRIEGSSQIARMPGGVLAFTPDSVTVGKTQFSSDGSYLLDLFQAQPVRLAVVIDDIVQWVGGADFDSATTFDPLPGDSLTDVSLVESGITCRLSGPGSFTDHRYRFLLRDDAGHELRSRSSERGKLTICNLRPGRYRLFLNGCCNGQTWAAQWYDGASSEADATVIELGRGELAEVTAHLIEGGRIAGVVSSSSSYRRVHVFSTSGFRFCEGGFYLDQGAFEVTGLPDGDYRLAASSWTGDLWWYPGTADPDSAGVVTIADHAAVSGIEWSVP